MAPRRPLPVVPSNLPCNPCPHGSRCCNQGTLLTDREALHIGLAHGTEFVEYLPPRELFARGWFDQPPEQGAWTTTITDGQCSLLRDNKCSIHDKIYYPRVCRDFPHRDTLNPSLPRAYDADTCPEVPR